MMVSKYIDNPEIRSTVEKGELKLPAVLCAYFVWANKSITLWEKHEAWRHISLEMEDMDFSCFSVPHCKTLFEILEKFIQIDKQLINDFYLDEKDCIYSHDIYLNESKIYEYTSTNSQCLDNEQVSKIIANSIESNVDNEIKIESKKSYKNCPTKFITLTTNKDGYILTVVGKGSFKSISKDLISTRNNFFDHFHSLPF